MFISAARHALRSWPADMKTTGGYDDRRPLTKATTSSLVYAEDKSAEHLISGCFADRKPQLQAWSGGFSPFRKYLPKMAYFQRTGRAEYGCGRCASGDQARALQGSSALSIFASAVTIWASATAQEEQIAMLITSRNSAEILVSTTPSMF
ncbi:hypothetical protein pRL100174 (plasmid) [Rhizobium johnstonii 3841]|uniref:Uncharacterized protein n=2 Tax=Rhizobium TaxID=379 RepID=Q1M7X9_RHIJ3|nr:hypothetical protein [Rhizobium laguerreae]CAK10398.1 hypothetical protein pRL100174 [Rhizobium johnstonii 3841]